jgi:hypothetical protein
VSRFERGSATALRLLVLLLAAYIIFHKSLPLSALDKRVADITVGEFLLIVFEALFALTAACYLVFSGFRYPSTENRDRAWCERWSAMAFGIGTITMATILVVLIERKGIDLGAAHWIASGILWLLF